MSLTEELLRRGTVTEDAPDPKASEKATQEALIALYAEQEAAEKSGKGCLHPAPEMDYSGRIGPMAPYEERPYETDAQGRRNDGHAVETWNDHGRTRDRCRYCQGKHDFNNCENEGNPQPGRGLIGPWFISSTGYKSFIGPVEGK